MFWTLVILGSLFGLAALTHLLGIFLPREHLATRSIVLPVPVDEAWKRIRNASDRPAWRRGLRSVEALEGPADAPTRWTECTNGERLSFVVEVEEPKWRLVTRIANTDLPFGGTWTIELASEEHGVRVRITEAGWVNPPIFRVLSKYVFGQHATLTGFLEDLAKSLGCSVKIES